MRVNPNPMPDLLEALNQSQLETQQAMLEISSGRSVNQPSDNPTAAALLVENNDQATFISGYLQSIGTVQSQLVSLANASYEGRYVFAGTNTNTPPFVVDNAVPSGVSYVGNTDVNQVSMGNGNKLAVNQPGSLLFSAPGNDVFLAINSLIQSLQSNTGIGAAVTSLGAANSYLSAQRVFYGNAANQAQSQSTYLNAAKLQIAQQQNTLGGADLAAAATNLARSQIDTQATLATISKLTQNNLFSYLK